LKTSWTKVVGLLNLAFNEYIKKYLVQFILKTIGASGGLWTTVVSFVLTKFYKYVKKEAESAAAIKDQEVVDRKLKEKHDQQLKVDTPESDLIQTEQDILNGGRKP
jgi:hypothetical protein